MPSEIQPVSPPHPAGIPPTGDAPAAPAQEQHNHHIPTITLKKRSKSEPNLRSLNHLPGENKPESGDKMPPEPSEKPDSRNAKVNARQKRSESLFRLISRELEYVKDTSTQLKNYDGLVEEKLKDALRKLEIIKNAMQEETKITPTPQEDDNDGGEDIEKELRRFKKYIRKLKLPIPSKFKKNAADLRDQWDLGDSDQQFATSLRKAALPKFHNNPIFENSPEFRDFEVRYQSLPIHLKLCLLCFSVFPEGEVIKKRLMVYWWIGEGFVTPEQDYDAEQWGAMYFDQLIRLEFISPYYGDKRSVEVDSCQMHPFVRSVLITLAARANFFDFDANGKPKAYCPSSFRACLIGDDGLDNDHDFDKIHLLFNVDETILEIKSEWFPKMKNVNVVCLGRWQAAANHHIEVEDTKFLEALSNMKNLKFLSLQGISRIMELPNSVTKLGNLTILDLRACPNLEVIPRDIGLLRSLTHLDLSECYLLDKMPKGLACLENLLVLKGFVVVRTKDSCSLEDLAKLPKLRKLSIFTGLREFPDEGDLKAFSQFQVLSKLKVVWGGGANKEDNHGDTPVATQRNHGVSSFKVIDSSTLGVGGDDNNAAIDVPTPASTQAPAPTPISKSKPATLLEPSLAPAPAPGPHPALAPASTSEQVPAPTSVSTPTSKTVPVSAPTPVPTQAPEPTPKPKPATLSEPALASASISEQVPAPTSTLTPTSKTAPVSAPTPVPTQAPAPTSKPKPATLSEPAAASKPGSAPGLEPALAPASTSEQASAPTSALTPASKTALVSTPTPGMVPKTLKVGKIKKGLTKFYKAIKSPHQASVTSNPLAADAYGLPDRLQKLDLQCFPKKSAPNWLKPTKLQHLKKLYIRGGQLDDLLGADESLILKVEPWNVEVLRLKYLNGLAMNWKELLKLFPKLVYLEKVKCPRLSLFPCDEAGVWLNKKEAT